jgi:hypothetical protein
VSSISEVGRERQLGQHGNVGNPIEASRGGVAHQRGVLVSGGGLAEEFTGARSEERRVALGVRLVGTEASWWSSGTGRQHQMMTQGGRRREALRRRQNPTVPDVGLLLRPAEEEEVSSGDRSTWQGLALTVWMRRRRLRTMLSERAAFKGVQRHCVRSARGINVHRVLGQADPGRGHGH